MLPTYLNQYIADEIASGTTDPETILRNAINRCNSVANEIVENRTARAKALRSAMCEAVYGDLS